MSMKCIRNNTKNSLAPHLNYKFIQTFGGRRYHFSALLAESGFPLTVFSVAGNRHVAAH